MCRTNVEYKCLNRRIGAQSTLREGPSLATRLVSRLRPGRSVGRSPATPLLCRNTGRQFLDMKGRVETPAIFEACGCRVAFGRHHQGRVMRWHSSQESFVYWGVCPRPSGREARVLLLARQPSALGRRLMLACFRPRIHSIGAPMTDRGVNRSLFALHGRANLVRRAQA